MLESIEPSISSGFCALIAFPFTTVGVADTEAFAGVAREEAERLEETEGFETGALLEDAGVVVERFGATSRGFTGPRSIVLARF